MSKAVEIRHHNALTNARYDYTELQLDLLFFLVSRLKKDQKDLVYELPIKDLATLTGKQYHYPYLRKATEAMGSRMFEVEDEKEYRQIWLFQQVRYLKGQGTIEFELSRAVLPFLFDLKDNFTSFELAAALRLSSKFAKRIYQLCSQWKDIGQTKKYDIQDFKKLLGLIDNKGNEKVKQIGQLREKVLDVAVRQINEHTELRIGYTLEKRGRSYKNIVFTVKSQAVATTVPFDLVPGAEPVPGVSQIQRTNAANLLAQLGIVRPELVNTILSSQAHIAACNKFAHDYKTGKVKVKSSLPGLLLAILGLANKDSKN